MAYRVRIESFEGPFDLLLYLVSKQKVDIGKIAITEITDQYLAEVERMHEVDLDVASDFLVVAATLLELKAASLISQDATVDEHDEDELSPYEMRDVLVEQLLEYKKFKNAARALENRLIAEQKIHVRPFGPDRSMLSLMPDYLRGVSLDKLGQLLANCLARRDVFLLESEHIAAKIIPLETRIQEIDDLIMRGVTVRFSDLISTEDDPRLIVVTFLAILELFKRSEVDVEQDHLFGDIVISPVGAQKD